MTNQWEWCKNRGVNLSRNRRGVGNYFVPIMKNRHELFHATNG